MQLCPTYITSNIGCRVIKLSKLTCPFSKQHNFLVTLPYQHLHESLSYNHFFSEDNNTLILLLLIYKIRYYICGKNEQDIKQKGKEHETTSEITKDVMGRCRQYRNPLNQQRIFNPRMVRDLKRGMTRSRDIPCSSKDLRMCLLHQDKGCRLRMNNTVQPSSYNTFTASIQSEVQSWYW